MVIEKDFTFRSGTAFDCEADRTLAIECTWDAQGQMDIAGAGNLKQHDNLRMQLPELQSEGVARRVSFPADQIGYLHGPGTGPFGPGGSTFFGRRRTARESAPAFFRPRTERDGGAPASSPGGTAGTAARRAANHVPPLSRNRPAGKGTPDLLPFCQGGRRAAGGCSVGGGKCRPGEIGMGGGFGLRGPAGREAISPGLGKRGTTAAVVRRPRRRGARFPHFPPAHLEDPFFFGGVAQAASLSRESFGS